MKINKNGWLFLDVPSFSIIKIERIKPDDDPIAGIPVPVAVISLGDVVVAGLPEEEEATVSTVSDPGLSIEGRPVVAMSDAGIRQILDDIFELRKILSPGGDIASLPNRIAARYGIGDRILDPPRFALLQREWPDTVFNDYLQSGGKKRFINDHFPSFKYLMCAHEKVHILTSLYGANLDESEILACLYDVAGPPWHGYSYRYLRLFFLAEKLRRDLPQGERYVRVAEDLFFEVLPQMAASKGISAGTPMAFMLETVPHLPESVLLGCRPHFNRLLASLPKNTAGTGIRTVRDEHNATKAIFNAI